MTWPAATLGAIASKAGTLHRIWFPLRSNATYFDGPEWSLELEARIKQAALLCEEIAFEPGLLDVTVTENGMMSFWVPPSQISEAEILRRRRSTEGIGTPVEFSIGVQPEPGVPASQMHRMGMSGSLHKSFVAEYHLLTQQSLPPKPTPKRRRAPQIWIGLERVGSRYSSLPQLSDNHFSISNSRKT